MSSRCERNKLSFNWPVNQILQSMFQTYIVVNPITTEKNEWHCVVVLIMASIKYQVPSCAANGGKDMSLQSGNYQRKITYS